MYHQAVQQLEPSKLELKYRLLLKDCDLIGQLAVSREELKTLRQIIDDTGLKSTRRQFAAFCRTHPAIISVFLTFSAVYEYISQTANFWDGVWSLLKMKRVYSRQELMGQTFNKFTKDMDLIQFESQTNIYIDPILLHASIPSECLENFFTQVIMPLSVDDNALDETTSLLKPVEEFIHKGGKVAENFIHRTLELYQALEKNPDITNQDPQQITQRFGLALHVVEELYTWFPTRITLSKPKRAQPRLLLDPYEMGLTIDIPKTFYQSTAVTVSCDTHSYTSDLYERNTVPLNGPAEKYLLSFADGTNINIPGLKMDAPHYFNMDTGRRLPLGLLPPGITAVLCPAGVIPEPETLIIEELPPLLGRWERAQILILDTQGHRYLNWKHADNQIIPEWTRAIDTHTAIQPQLIGGKWQPEIASPNTPMVYLGNPPVIKLPQVKEKLDRYHLQVETAQAVIYDGPLAALEGSDGFELSKILEGIYGRIMLSIRGPLGSDQKIEFILLPEGFLELIPTEKPTVYGLVLKESRGIRAQINAERGWMETKGIYLPSEDTAEITLRCIQQGNVTAKFPIRLRGIEWRLMTGDEPAAGRWSWQETQIALDRGPGPTAYLLSRSYFTNGSSHALTLWGNQQGLQTLTGTYKRTLPQRERFILNSFFDVMQKHAQDELELVLSTRAGHQTYTVPLAELMFSWHIMDLKVFPTERIIQNIVIEWT